MRGVTTALGLGVLVAGAGVLPAEAVDPAPTNVQVAWANAEHTAVRVTWNEVGTVANRIQWRFGDQWGTVQETAAGAANQVDLPTAGIGGDPVVRVGVFAMAGGEPSSEAGFSAPFDSLQAPRPVIDSLVSLPPTRYRIKWHPAPATTDPNPGDPLDLPAGTPRYQVLANYGNFNQYEPRTPVSATTEAEFEQLTAPAFKVTVTSANEWGLAYARVAGVDYERIMSLTIPAAANYGQLTVIKGRLVRMRQACDPGPCWSMEWPEPPRTVVLQARSNASSPWYVVGSTTTTSTGTFTITPPTQGTRQYRIVVPDVFNDLGLGLGVGSGAVTTLAKPRVSAGFVDSTVAYGQRVTARVSMAPPANIRTTFQRWDGSAWRDLKWVYTSNGSGSYTFAATQRGRVAYRFLVPNFTYAGRPLSWQVSPTIVLTTS